MGSVPDVEKQRFANLMSSGTSILLRRVTQVETVGANDRVTPPLTLYTALLSGAAAFEAPQVDGSLQTVAANFTQTASKSKDPVVLEIYNILSPLDVGQDHSLWMLTLAPLYKLTPTPPLQTEAVLLRQRRVGHPFRHWLSFLLPIFVTKLMLQTRFFSCPIPLLPNLTFRFECLVDCAFCVLRPLLVVLGPEYLIPIQLDLDHFRTSSNFLLPCCLR